MALASRDDLCFVALSLVCMSIYLPVCHVFLFMGGAKTVSHRSDNHTRAKCRQQEQVDL